MERLANVDTVVLDKTGTLTEGKPRLRSVQTLESYSAKEVLRLASAVESSTIHPLATAVRQAALEAGGFFSGMHF